jgi:hypothetical protein
MSFKEIQQFSSPSDNQNPKMEIEEVEWNGRGVTSLPRGTLSFLPDEIIVRVLSYLSIGDLTRLARTCEDLNRLSNDPLFLGQFEVLKKPRYESLKRNGMNGFFTTKTECAKLNIDGLIIHKGLYFIRSDSSIIIWDPNTGKEINSHGTIWSITGFYVAENHLFSGIEEGNIDIWDLETMKLVCTLKSNKPKDVYNRSIDVQGDFIFVGYQDGCVSIWNWKTEEFLKELKIIDDGSAIPSLQVKDNFLFVSDERNIQIIDLQTGKLLNHLKKDKEVAKVHFFQVLGDNILSYIKQPSGENEIYVWNWKTNEKILSYEENKTISCMLVDEDVVFLGFEDGTIEMRDLTNMRLLFTFDAGADFSVDHLQFIGDLLVCGCFEGGMRIFDFSVSRTQALLEIAVKLKLGNPDSTHFAMLPEKIKGAVYDELRKIESFENDYPGCAEDAFWERNGLSTTNEKRAEAIENYSKKQDQAK